MIAVREFGNAVLNRLDRSFNSLKECAYFDFGLMSQYQPHPLKGCNLPAERENESRWIAIDAALPAITPMSSMDIGCNIGFFTFRMAKHGGTCVGIDIGENEIRAARAIAENYRIPNVSFLCNAITPESAEGLPKTDIVICMSVFHHWVRKSGFDQAALIMRTLADRCMHTMIFETGQHNETATDWWQELDFMGDDSEAWIVQFLQEMGFDSVSQIGSFGTSLSDVKRGLFAAMKTC